MADDATTILLLHTLDALRQVGVQDDAVRNDAEHELLAADAPLTVHVTTHW